LNPAQPDTSLYAQENDTLDVYNDTTDADDLPGGESNVDLSEVMKRFEADDNSGLNADKGTLREKMLMEIIKYLNTPYKYGGTTKRGIDCSAFTQKVFRNALSVDLNRTAREQFKEGETISSIDDLHFGDLVFFNTRRRVRPGHVGIYIGDHLFAHSSSRYGVTVSTLDHNYYSRRFMGGRRIEDIPNSNKVSERSGN
jgi:cell wall-associated NlpC family hydrolase